LEWLMNSLVGFCIVFCSTSIRADDQSDILSIARQGHRSAREAIQTLSATIAIERTFPEEKKVISGKYWRSFNLIRVQENYPDSGIEEYLWKDSEIRQVGHGTQARGGQHQFAASRRSPSEKMFCICNVWTQMMIDFSTQKGGDGDLDFYIESAKRPPSVSRDKIEGNQCIRIKLTFETPTGDEKTVALWFEESHNYLIRKMVTTFSKSSDKFEGEILEFMESPPGVFLPIKCRRQIYRKGKLEIVEQASLSDVHINEPNPENVFQLPAIPPGTILYDGIQGTKYPVDENWRPIGPATPLLKAIVAGSSDGFEDEYRSQSTEESKSFWRWLIPASLVVLVVGFVSLIYRRYGVRLFGATEKEK
jgi:hypothetical protein